MAESRSLFGFEFKRKAIETEKKPVSFTPDNEDGAYEISPTGGYFGQYMDLNGDQYKNDKDLIMKYRSVATYPEVDMAIEDICNEAITDENGIIATLNLDNLDQADNVKDLIQEEFQRILNLTNFSNTAYDTFRRWYIDGRLFYHKVIDLDNPRKGITELRYIDPMKIKKVRQKIDNTPKDSLAKAAIKGTALEYEYGTFVDYYLYNPKGFYKCCVLGPIGDMSLSQGVKMATDSITFCPSGLQDLNKRMTLGFLHKAIKTLNQLRMIEDSIVIYRLSRAPERRIFYIDVGNLPKVKAEQYLRDVMSRYRNKLVYDAQTG